MAEASGWSDALSRARAAGRPLLDLTVTNPTRCGFRYQSDVVLQALQRPEAMGYDADPLGMREARSAIAEAYYGARGVPVSPDAMLLTASTSEAYGFLLRLLCNPGDQILVPQPSYPLFDLLARMHDVDLRTYPLVFHDGWQIDPDGLERAITPRTKAILVVHPNNPTGHFASAADQRALRAAAERHGIAIIADEVFLDYAGEVREAPASFAAKPWPSLCFVLSGISKVLALPQMKLAWTVVCGPEAVRQDAMERLAVIADTFLNVSAPIQLATGTWLRDAGGVRQEIQGRVDRNLALLRAVCRGDSQMSVLPVEGGWSAVVRVPAIEEDTDLARRVLEEKGIVVHPASLYGFPGRGWMVLSLLTPEPVFAEGVHRLGAAVTPQLPPSSPG